MIQCTRWLVVACVAGGLAQAQGEAPAAKCPSEIQQQMLLNKLDDVLGLELANAAGEELGEIQDLWIDARDGSIDFVILGCGGSLGVGEAKRVVPWTSVRILPLETSPKELRAHTELTTADIKCARRFDEGRRVLLNTELTDPGQPPAAEPANVELQWIRASELAGTSLLGASGVRLGKIEDVIVDARDGFVAYLVIQCSTSGSAVARFTGLPWTVARFKREKGLAAHAPLTKDQIANGPEYDPLDWQRMRSPLWVRDVAAHFSVEPYFAQRRSSEARPDGATEKH